MAAKKVRVEVKQGSGFRTECRVGKHIVIIDQPVAAGGTDEGPTPLDYQMVALGGCIVAIGRIIARQRNLTIRGFDVLVEGELDTDRLMGKAQDKRAGFSSITAHVKIDSDLSPEEQKKFLHEIDERCPISENLQNATQVSITLAA